MSDKPKKRGAPFGNKNAVGNKGGGAPLGNANALRHGLYTNEPYRWTMHFYEQRMIETGTWDLEELKELSKQIKANGAYLPWAFIRKCEQLKERSE